MNTDTINIHEPCWPQPALKRYQENIKGTSLAGHGPMKNSGRGDGDFVATKL